MPLVHEKGRTAMMHDRREWLKGLGFSLLVLAGWSALVGAAQAAKPDDGQTSATTRVFYTGHSFHMFVPARIDQLVKLAGITDYKLAGSQGIGGSKVIQHWDKPDGENRAKPALETGDVDVFTMAAHLLVPDPGIDNFAELGLKHNPKLRLLVQGSWYPFDVASPEKRVKDNSTRDGAQIADLQAAVDEWRTRLEAQADALNKKYDRQAVFIVPVGDAVVKLRQMIVDGKFPGLSKQSELFRDPIGHGNGHVMALAAYCNYAAIFGRSPEGLKLNEPGVDDAQHAILQRIAWETVSGYSHSGVKAK